MRALRAILRLDYERNYEMINRPGTVAKLLSDETPAGFFDFFGEDRGARRLIAKRVITEKARYRALTVEPTAIVLDLESVAGWPIQAIEDSEDFLTLCAVANALLKEFKITKFERAGLRLFLFGQAAPTLDKVVLACRGLVNTAVISAMQTHTGKVKDVGIAMESASDAKVSYLLKFGPFTGPEEYPKYFSSINDLLPKEPTDNTLIDLDMYERKFTFGASNIAKWCVPQFNIGLSLSKQIVEIVAESAK